MISYLKEYGKITAASIKNPDKFFEKINKEKQGYLKPFAYMILSYIVYNVGFFLGFLFFPEGLVFLKLSLAFKGLVIFSIIFTIISILLYFILMHLSVLIVGGKGKFKDTFKAVCYSYSPFNFAWIFGFGVFIAMSFGGITAMLITIPLTLALIASIIYVYYILVVGISVTSKITKLRAFAALLIQMFIYSFFLTILILGLIFIFIYSYGPGIFFGNAQNYEDSAMINNYEHYNITAYKGLTPEIDGINDYSDAWHEGEQIQIEYEEKTHIIIMKHDLKNLYLLMEWEGSPEWKDNINIYFEQDGDAPDHDLSNGRVDNYYQGSPVYGPQGVNDAHYEPGYSVSEEQNGVLKAGHNNSTWVLEWQIPLKSGDINDIYIDKYPLQLGFAVVNWGTGIAKGLWPPNADPYKPNTWAKMIIVDKRKK